MSFTAKLVAAPDKCAPQVRAVIKEFEAICFPADTRVKIKGSFWWFLEAEKSPVAYAALRPCGLAINRGMGFLLRAGVLPEWRGMGLQRQLIAARVQFAKRSGLSELVTYTVPTNLASANSLIGEGFKLYEPTSRWGGKAALYFRAELTKSSKPLHPGE